MKNQFVGEMYVIGGKYEITGLQISEKLPAYIINHKLGKIDLKKINVTQAEQLEKGGCIFIQKYEPEPQTVSKTETQKEPDKSTSKK